LNSAFGLLDGALYFVLRAIDNFSELLLYFAFGLLDFALNYV
jgi:hypothetical protein